MNRLAQERSPYLLQHASNPVDWFAWGDAAFAKARTEGKPIFLSIGYSTCHWCHVMEHESFESAEIAALLNDKFVSIKVDREERPDVDRVYMAFVQSTTGSGGWPMSVWLTPELKPFYGGTYFPPSSRWGRPGFSDILEEIVRVWNVDRQKVVDSADAIVAQLRQREPVTGQGPLPPPEALDRLVAQFGQSFDRRLGGFGGAPKFPRPSELLFLLREFARTGRREGLDVVLATLRAMAEGGIRDHVGGGFHRYAVDAAWRVPHFEKMLYDQGQLALAFLEAAQASGDRFFLDVAEDTLGYVMRDLTDAGGGFHSAEDADSIPPEAATSTEAHKAEGAFYLWRADELAALLGADADLVTRRFGVRPGGNAPSDPQQEFTGKNILYVASSIEDLAAETGASEEEVIERLNRARTKMFLARRVRPRPHLDDKVLTAWNGLTIAALGRAARVVGGVHPLGQKAGKPYLVAARRAATFIRDRMWDARTGRLRRRFREDDVAIDAYAEDYAYLIFGLLELFQADPDVVWLEWAIALQRILDDLFWDDEGGGWFSTTGRDPNVLLRMKEDYDGAEPTASAVAVWNLLTLSHLVDDPVWAGRIERTLAWSLARIEQMGRAVPMMAAALSTYLAGTRQVVVVHNAGSDGDAAAFVRTLGLCYLPFTTVLAPTPDQQERLTALLPQVAAMRPVNGAAAAYVCQNFSCRPPLTTPEALQAVLEERG